MSDVLVYSDVDYKRAFTEVIEVLKYIPRTDLAKIPEEVINTLVVNSDQSYNFEIDKNKEFKNIALSDLTLAILENFYRDYWITDIEREKMLQEEKIKRDAIEKEKSEKYNIDNLFKKEDANNKPVAMVEVKEETWFEKIIKSIKKWFGKI